MKERVFLSNNQDGIIENYWMMHFLNVTDVLTNYRINCSGSTSNLTLFWRVVRDLCALLTILEKNWFTFTLFINVLLLFFRTMNATWLPDMLIKRHAEYKEAYQLLESEKLAVLSKIISVKCFKICIKIRFFGTISKMLFEWWNTFPVSWY